MRRPTSLLTPVKLDYLIDQLFFCPACATWRLPTASTPRTTRQNTLHRRSASTLTSSTAINATKPIPQQFKALHEALSEVQKKAAAQVNLSRLQLALQGLESQLPTTRVAVLGLNVQDTASRIVRLLLADALIPEQRWESHLLRAAEEHLNGLLIRYGEPSNRGLPPSRSSVPVLYVPSPILERMNIEILLSHVPTPGSIGPSSTTTPDTFLSPIFTTPASVNGRHTTISQPVHKSLLVARNLEELVRISALLATTKFLPEDRALIDVVLDIRNPSVDDNPMPVIDSDGSESSTTASGTIIPIDVARAESGLEDIRTDLGRATNYEHKWIEARMPPLSRWLTLSSSLSDSSKSSELSLPAPIRILISSILTSASRNITTQALTSSISAYSTTLSLETVAVLEKAIDSFSQSAHQELQSGISSAWSTRNWQKLAWWKLFWRVDDVGLIVSDLVTNAWLVQAEKNVFEMQGRLKMANIEPVGVDPVLPDLQVEAEDTKQYDNNVIHLRQVTRVFPPEVPSPAAVTVTPSTAQASRITQPVLINPTGSSISVRLPTPALTLSSAISTTRQRYTQSAINNLTSSAQTIVLNALSITSLTAALSGLAYFSVTAGSIYEAGTIVALGTSFALYRMQGEWQRACKGLEHGLFENGREVIRWTERQMRQLVHDAATAKEDDVEIRMRKDAEKAIDRAREELETLQ